MPWSMDSANESVLVNLSNARLRTVHFSAPCALSSPGAGLAFICAFLAEIYPSGTWDVFKWRTGFYGLTLFTAITFLAEASVNHGLVPI
jgi:hypothetical protein